MNLKITLIALLSLMSFSTTAQEIAWNESVKKEQKYFYYFQPVNEKENYSISMELGSSIKMLHYTDNVVDGENTFKLEVGAEKYDDYRTFIVNGNMVFFFSVGKKENSKVYFQSFDKTCKPLGEPEFAFDLVLGKRESFSKLLDFSQSDNKKFISVSLTPGKTESSSSKPTFRLYDLNMSMITEKQYSPDPELGAKYDRITVSNTGTVILGYSLPKKASGNKPYFLHVINANDKESDFTFEVDDQDTYNDIHVKVNNETQSVFLVGSFYSTTEKTWGSFNVKLDLIANTASKPVKGFFSSEFLIKGRTEREKKYYDKLAAKGKYDKYPGSFELREIIFTEDDRIIVIYEHYRLVIIEKRDSKTNMVVSTTYQYDFNDVILAKFGKQEGFEWTQKIVKRQREVNFVYDAGIAVCNDGSNVFIFFNDNIKNYTPEKEFISEGKDIAPMLTSPSAGCLVLATVNQETGEMKREIKSLQKETKLICRPHDFQNLPTDGIMLVYAANRFSEKFGIFKY